MSAETYTNPVLPGIEFIRERPIRQYLADGVYLREIRLSAGEIASIKPRERSSLLIAVRGRVTVTVGAAPTHVIGPVVVFIGRGLMVQAHAHDDDTVLMAVAPCASAAETDAGVFEAPGDVVITRNIPVTAGQP